MFDSVLGDLKDSILVLFMSFDLDESQDVVVVNSNDCVCLCSVIDEYRMAIILLNTDWRKSFLKLRVKCSRRNLLKARFVF